MNENLKQQVERYPIVVFGAGIVGLTLALRLNQLGFKIALISNQPLKKNPKLSKLSMDCQFSQLKVSALSKASLAYLQSLGLEDEINQFGHFYQTMEVVDQQRLIHFNLNHHQFDRDHLVNQFDAQKDKNLNPSLGVVIANCYLEQKLSSLVYHSKIDFFQLDHYQNEDALDRSIEITSDQVKIKLANHLIESDLIVAADGANSLIRKLAGMDVCQKQYQQKAIVSYIKVSEPIENLAWQCFIGEYTLALLPCFELFDQNSTVENENQTDKNQQQKGYHYSMVWTMSEAKFQAIDQDQSKMIDEIEAITEQKFGKVMAISKLAHFDLTRSQALDYAGQRVFLVGDAAHSIHPLAGMGLNLGLKDSKQLANHLAKLNQSAKNIGDYQNLKPLANQLFINNQFAQNLMDWIANFYRLKPFELLSSLPLNKQILQSTDWFKLTPNLLKKEIIRYIQGIS